jgi:hypothetical protein
MDLWDKQNQTDLNFPGYVLVDQKKRKPKIAISNDLVTNQ